MAIKSRDHIIAALGIIALLVAVLYGNSLLNGFIHDDHGQVENNTYIQNLMYLPKIFTSCIWESAVGNCKDTYYYRPLQSLSYMITYQFLPRPWVFHLVNLIYFAIDVCLVYVLIRLLTKNSLLSILTAGIFLIHPLNAEVVNWIATVPELLFVLFTLLSTILFILYRQTAKRKYLWWLVACFSLGILAKEPAVFVPFVFLTLDFTYFRKKIADYFNWKNIEPYILALLSFLAYLAARFSVLGGLGADPYYKLTLFQRIYIFVSLFGSYARKLIYPYPMNLFYTFHTTYNVFTDSFITSAGFLISFIFILYLSIRKRWTSISLALVWYLVFLAPSLIFINSIGENLFAERHVYASTIGFALIIAYGLTELIKFGKWGKVVVGIVAILTITLSWRLITARTALWHDDETIYADTLTKSPDADLIRYNLAYLYEHSGKTDQAIKQYSTILTRKGWRGIAKAYNNLGNIAIRQKNYAQASKYFQQAIAADPLHVESYNNLGAMALEQGDILGSLLYLCSANQINPMFADANNNLDHVISVIQGMDEKDYAQLYHELLTGGTFTQSKDTSVTLQGADCSGDSCLYTFTNPARAKTFVLSFLIGGQTPSGEIVRPRRFGIRQKTGDIVLDLDKKWQDSGLQFIFPACGGVYYQVSPDR